MSVTRDRMKLVPVILFVVTALMADEVNGWKSARFGMTEAEVKDAFKGEVKEFAKPEKWKSGFTPIFLPLQIAEKPWTARFIFDQKTKTLTEVVLRPDKSV